MKKYLSIIPGKIIQYFIDSRKYSIALLLSKWFIFVLRDKTPPSVATCFRALSPANRDTYYWHILGGSRGRAIQKITRRLNDGCYKDTVPLFRKVLESKFDSTDIIASWENAYNVLLESWSQKKTRLYNPLPTSSKTKIFASGMLRSGSSAVFNYLQQFGTVNAYEQEYAFVEEDAGLYNLVNRIKINENFVSDLTRYFFVTLFSYADFKNSGEYKAAYKARKLIKSGNGLHYVDQINEFIKIIIDVRNGFIPEKSGFNTAFDVLLKAFGGPVNRDDYSHILLNNVIHLYNLEAFSLFQNSWLLCVFRDPRTTFIARQKEKRGYIQTVTDFIEEYRKQRKDFISAWKMSPNKKYIKINTIRRFCIIRRVPRGACCKHWP